MNLRIIHSEFELNLVDTSFTMVAENNWFSDRIFSKYTFPISKTLTDEEDAAFGFITQYAARGLQTIFDVVFEAMDTQHEAVMEIEKIVGRKIEFQIRYGFEDFPNFEKKLAQLPLHKFVLDSETIFEHAEDRIALAYPDTDYNFPQIFTDKFDTESPQWQAFQGRINNYTGTAFLLNEYDVEDDLQLNRNIMQPLPSLLYVLKAGFADKGYTLAGDILEDPQFKDAFLYSLSEFYSSITDAGKQEMIVKCDDYYDLDPDARNNDGGLYNEEIIIAEPGKYKIAGNLFVRAYARALFKFGQAKLFLNGELIGSWNTISDEKFIFLDKTFEVLPGQSDLVLNLISSQRIYANVGGTRVYDATIMDITVTQLTKYNPDGSATPTLILPNEIDLTKCVPDITFGDLYKAIKLWKNYGVSIEGDVVSIDLVKNQIGKGKLKDLSHREVMEPERTFNSGKTFELKFTEIESDDYEFPSIYVDHTGPTQSPYVVKEGTEEIIIDAVPLPLKTEGGVRTAHGFLDDNQKIQLVLYTGLTGSVNITDESTALTIPIIYEDYYREWIDFLLKTIGYLWTFNSTDLFVRDLQERSTVFAYGIYHVVLKLSKKNMAPGIVQSEIETYSIE